MKKIFLFLLLIILIESEVFAENWQKVAPNNYVDFETVVGSQDVYGYSFLLKSYNKGQYEPVNGRKIYYTLSQNEIDCAKRKYKIGVIDSYDQDDIFINGDYNKYAEFQPIVTGTAINEIAKNLCKF